MGGGRGRVRDGGERWGERVQAVADFVDGEVFGFEEFARGGESVWDMRLVFGCLYV